MKKYIVSVVMTKVTKAAGGAPDISLQNVVGVCSAGSPEEAYGKVSARARLQYPDHHIAVKVVVETTEADLEN